MRWEEDPLGWVDSTLARAVTTAPWWEWTATPVERLTRSYFFPLLCIG